MGNEANKPDKLGFFKRIWAWDMNKKFYQNARFWTVLVSVLFIGMLSGGSPEKSDTDTSGSPNNNQSNNQSQEDAERKAQEKAEQEAREEAERQANIASATTVKYTDLFRNSNEYQGKYIKFTGKVLQTDSNNSYCRVATKKSSYGNDYYEDVLFVSPCKADNKILEDDLINFVGIGDGTQTYTTVLGAKNELPRLKAVKINIAGHID